MDIFGILTLIGGLSLFLYGMSTMGDGLTKLSGGSLERILERLTSTKLKALLLGTLVTAVIQSSSATTVMVVGFVNSGIMRLVQAAPIIMGANIGTTITSWLLSLVGIQGSSVWVKLLKPSSFSPVLAAIGIISMMTAKENDRKRDIGNILLGFAILMFGMQTMSDSVAPLAGNERFTGLLTMFSNPILGMAAGAVLTAVIQSSSASVGILQALCATGAIGYSSAIPIIMGQNIGTCITAVLSAIGASKNAKRAAMLHLYFNLIGTLIFMVAFYFLNSVIGFAFMGASASAAGIAVIHSLFNIGCAIVLFPFTNLLLKLATYTIPDREQEAAEETALERPRALMALDERFLEKPAFAMALCRRAAIHMAEEVRTSIFLALNMISEYNEDNAIRVAELEQLVDLYEDRLGTYLVKLSGRDLSIKDSRSMSILLHCISDFERMSDHAANIKDSLSKMKKKKLAFSPKARAELEVLTRAVHDIVEATCQVFAANDVEGAKHIEPLEEVIDRLNVKLRQHHVKRLRKGKCTIELGIVLEDIITDLERISDHCSNVAVCLIQVNADGFDTHEYLDIDMKESEAFKEEVRTMREQYRLPGNG